MVNEDILRFEISVCDEVVVSISDSADNLFEEKPGVIFMDIVVLNIVIEFTPFGEFHDDEDIVGCI